MAGTIQSPVDAHGAEVVYLIRRRMGGFANDVTIQTEGGPVLYHVRSKVLSPLGRRYGVYTDAMEEVLGTEQDHTAIFPRHTLYAGEREVGKLGQKGILPEIYFVHLHPWPRAEIHVGGFESIFRLIDPAGIVAEVATHRTTWIVVIPWTRVRFLILCSIAIIFRENTIGG